jgi:hypothetical protein
MSYTGSTPGPMNTFVPSFQASGELIINYSRNVKDFPVNRYISIAKVEKDAVYFLAITPDSAGRINNLNLADFTWADGNYAPSGVWNNAVFNFSLVNTQRYCFPFLLGAKAVNMADWPILAVESGQMAQLAMTGRTLLAASLIFNATNYDSNHTATVHNILAQNFPAMSAGNWATGTSTNPVIKACINYGKQQIQKTTLSAVKRDQMILLVSPSVATTMSISPEVTDFCKSSPFAMAQLRGDIPWINGAWGLPDVLYDTPVIVDDTSYVSSELGASTTVFNYVYDAISGSEAALISRPGGLEGTYGTRSFSSITMFALEEMTVESLYDTINRLFHGRVVEDYVVVMTAPAATYLFQAIFTS